MNLRPPEIWLIAGASESDRAAVAQAIAGALDRAAHVSASALWEQIVAGRERPGPTLEGEAERQFELVIRNQCLLARSYAEAGFTPILDHDIRTLFQLDAYRHYLAGGALHFVSVGPSGELERVGLHLDDAAAADAVLDRREDARLS